MIKINNETQVGKLIENQFGEHYLFSVNRKSFEQLDYKTQFNKEFSQTFSKEDTLYIIVGTDSGLMVNQLLKNLPQKGSAYLFIEFPEIIERIQSQYDVGDQKRIIVTTEDQWQAEAQKLGMETYFMINRVRQVKSFCAQYYYLNEYLFLRKSIEDTVNHLTWQYQTQLGSNIFVQRQLENLAENQNPAILLKDYYQGKSALILAGGPSLDTYIDWIEKNQEHFVVIAVTRIARRLLETKIRPDIFVSVDPHPANFRVSKEVFSFENESLLVNQYHISPRLLGNWLGNSLYLGNLFPWKSKLNVENLIGIGPTVTNTAILLAFQMGIKEHILFGVDLCYSSRGYSHASGSREYNSGPDVNLMGQKVITNCGMTAETNSAYFEAIDTIEQLAEIIQQSDGVLINPSPNSAKMKNVRHILIDDINIPEEQVCITNFLEQELTQSKDKKIKLIHYKEVLNELKKAQIKIEKIKTIANQGLEYNHNLFSGDDPSTNYKFKLKMDKLEKRLNNKELTDFTELAKKFGVKEFLHFLRPDSESEWTNDEIMQSGNTYYKALKSGAIELSKEIFTAINRIEIRLLEQRELIVNDDIIKRHLSSFDSITTLKNRNKDKQNIIASNTKNLMSAFHEDSILLGSTYEERRQAVTFYMLMLQNGMNYQMRRMLVLKKENADLFNLSNKIVLLDNLIEGAGILGRTVKDIKMAHENIINAWTSQALQNFEQEISKLEGLEIKLYNLFLLKDIDSLKRIISSIELIDNLQTEKPQFLHLAKGYLSELQNNENQAIDEYGYADSSQTIESALKRLAFISLNRGELEYAHGTLQMLCQLSPAYLVQLSELYQLTKNYKDALDSYSNYLEYYPTDISVLLKMAKLYESEKVFDGARFIYNEILKIEPENQTVKKQLDNISSFG